MSSPSDTPAFGPVAPYYEALMAGVPYRFWVEYLERLWALHARKPQEILDLACGTGTVSRLLVPRGYFVTGVDLSEGMLDVARRRAAELVCRSFFTSRMPPNLIWARRASTPSSACSTA